jgi:hypothetical protein
MCASRRREPTPGPAITAELLDAACGIRERVGDHLAASCCAFGQRRFGLLGCAPRSIELRRQLQMRSGQAQPLAANIVHMREDRGDGASLIPWRFGSSCARVKMHEHKLVHAVVDGVGLCHHSVGLWIPCRRDVRHGASSPPRRLAGGPTQRNEVDQRSGPAIRDVFAHAPPHESKISAICTSQKSKAPRRRMNSG